MLRNYVKIALRNLRRNRAYALINITGLALGLSCVLLIFMLVKYHLSFDNFHHNKEDIYRIVAELHADNTVHSSGVPNVMVKSLKQDVPAFESISQVAYFQDELVTVNVDKKFKEEEIAFVEPAYFDIFNFPLVRGGGALTEPNTAYITEKIAYKYFGNEDAINKTIRVDNRQEVKIIGVLKDLPTNTVQRCQVLISMATLKTFDPEKANFDSWFGFSSSLQCFVKMKPGASLASTKQAFAKYEKIFEKTTRRPTFIMQPLSDVHFNSHYGGTMAKRTLWILSFIGLFLIITAAVNFINLATAQAVNRSREVGVRKVLGSQRSQLFWQFIAETGLITFSAGLIAIVVSQIALPFMNSWFHTSITVSWMRDWQLVGFIALLLIVTTLLSGAYPGLILAGFQPVQALQNKITQQQSGSFNTRRILIITQFAISQVLIIGMIVIAKQMAFAQASDTGFQKDAIVMLPLPQEGEKGKMETLQRRMLQIAGVEDVSRCFSAPASGNNMNTNVRFDNRDKDELFDAGVRPIDEHYISTFGLQLVAGRNIFRSDSVREFVVNETFARKLNVRSPEELLGKMVALGGDKPAPIVGVVKDFHDRSYHDDINALCMMMAPNFYSYFALKINMGNAPRTMKQVEQVYNEIYPDRLYEYQFLDDSIASFYEAESLLFKLITAFCIIAVVIGSLGLFGLMSFMIVQKNKEIGIRKILGGDTLHIVWIFGKEFFSLILVAFLVAGPLAWFVMNSWLDSFKFRININAIMFIKALLFTVIIATLTVGYQSVKAALANPLKQLKKV
jgi:putative ABC transport system permease protein